MAFLFVARRSVPLWCVVDYGNYSSLYQGFFVDFSSLSAPLLKAERKRLGFSQADAAEKCGVSREIWGRYERGVVVPGGEVLKALADLGADVQYILTGSPAGSNTSAPTHLTPDRSAPTDLPSDEQLLLESYRGLAPAERKALLAELLTGGQSKKTTRTKPAAPSDVTVTGNGNRTAGRDYHED